MSTGSDIPRGRNREGSVSQISIRVYRQGDHAAISAIFTTAIHEIASAQYTEQQCLAWSDRLPNPEHWRRRCELKRPFVAEIEGEIAGFLELDPDGHIDCAYVNPKYQRQGVVTALVRHAIQTCWNCGLPRVYVEASLCARALFEKLGFRVTEERVVDIRGVELANFAMELLRPTDGARFH